MSDGHSWGRSMLRILRGLVILSAIPTGVCGALAPCKVTSDNPYIHKKQMWASMDVRLVDRRHLSPHRATRAHKSARYGLLHVRDVPSKAGMFTVPRPVIRGSGILGLTSSLIPLLSCINFGVNSAALEVKGCKPYRMNWLTGTTAQ